MFAMKFFRVLSRPPAFFLMSAFLFLGHLLDLVSGIPDDAVKDAATHVFAVGIALIGKIDHLLNQSQRSSEIVIAGLQNQDDAFRRRW